MHENGRRKNGKRKRRFWKVSSLPHLIHSRLACGIGEEVSQSELEGEMKNEGMVWRGLYSEGENVWASHVERVLVRSEENVENEARVR
ncbi:unnamed protein product [Sphenostylis stenocarpa]|uniref:Uncharacterized protein n=1 Tax=Sphenostylis stenocarpa TaxID=92480 RepID=A0AA86SSF9_9FABA|nr:unnamed protein product [Sphenostylis stenocarpa]